MVLSTQEKTREQPLISSDISSIINRAVLGDYRRSSDVLRGIELMEHWFN